MLSLHAVAIGTFEYANCIMYIQDFIIFNDYCLLMCLVPLLVAAATLIQFAYYVTLIQKRLHILANLLKGHKCPLMAIKFNYPRPGDVEATGEETMGKKLDIGATKWLYMKLQEATEILNSAFGIQLLVLLTTCFITLTTLSYYIVMQVIRWVWGNGFYF